MTIQEAERTHEDHDTTIQAPDRAATASIAVPESPRLVEGRARVSLFHMCGSINGFEDNRIQIHQTLGVKPFPDGRSGMSSTRDEWA